MTSTPPATSNISVIIPTLNEADNIAKTIQRAASPATSEIIIADGGSTDATINIAASCGAKVLSSAPGRAVQMNHGAAAAQGHILLFLHADTLLPQNFHNQIIKIINTPGTAAGAFHFAIDLPNRAARLIEFSTNIRSKLWQLPYGDQAIFLKHQLFNKIGGYHIEPILEDVILIKQLKQQGHIRIAPGVTITNSRRWRELGLIKTTLINQKIMLGYLLGLPPQLLKGWYRIDKK